MRFFVKRQDILDC